VTNTISNNGDGGNKTASVRSSAVTVTVNKASGATVNAPTGTSSVSHNSITINAVTAPTNGQTVEYAKNTVNTAPASGWQTSTTFTGLNGATTYYIFARAAENADYETGAASGSLVVATTSPSSLSEGRFEYYWVDRHGSLVTTSGGETTIKYGETLTISAQGDGYDVRQWYLNGMNTGKSGDTYTFLSTIAGKHTVSWLVEKDGKLYNTNLTITVLCAVKIDMYDSYGDGWNGNGALRINVNGLDIVTVKVESTAANNTPSGQRNTNTYTFPVVSGDVVQVYWIAGTDQDENSFIVYYTDRLPSPVFSTDNTGPTSWSGSNALVYRVRGNAPAGLNNVTNNTLLGSFTVH
jgi:hypothetical protein